MNTVFRLVDCIRDRILGNQKSVICRVIPFFMTKFAHLEYWLRGPVPGIPSLLQPAAHAILQAREEVTRGGAGSGAVGIFGWGGDAPRRDGRVSGSI